MIASVSVKFVSRCRRKVSLLSPANFLCAYSGSVPIRSFRSLSSSRGFGPYPRNRWMTFITVDSPWSWSFFTTHSSPDIGEAADEVLGKILNSSNSASKLSENDHAVLVSKLCRAGERHDFKLSCQIFKELLSFGKPLSSSCYLDLARAFIMTDECSHLLRFVEEISDSTLSSSLTIVNRIILAFAESRQIDKVLMIFDQLKDWECKPDLVTYNTVLDILGRSGCLNKLLQLFASMKEDSVIPDIVTYNTLLNGLRKIGRLDMCLVIYREMCDGGIQPDLLTYTAMIDSFGRSGKIEESLRLFDEMKQKKVRPSVYIYRALIDSLKKLGKVELATKLLEEMNSSSADMARPEDFKRKPKTV